MKREKFADLSTRVPGLARYPQLLTCLEDLLGISMTRKLFEAASVEKQNPFQEVSQLLDFRCEFIGERLPETGPLVVVANHAYGGADALAAAAHCLACRPDVKILANAELTGLAGISPWLIPVSILGEEEATKDNVAGLRAALKHVKKGGCLVVFPSGAIALWRGDRIQDPMWKDHTVKLIQRMKAPILPVWFFGGIPPLLKVLSRCSVFLRRALIPRGLLSMRGKRMTARVGEPFLINDLGDCGCLSDSLRSHLEQLRDLGN